MSHRATETRTPDPSRAFWIALVVASVVVLSGPSASFAATSPERAPIWRVYRAEDGLSESITTAITVSPRGNVWVKHGDVDAVSLLDGYTVQRIPAPGERWHRVYQSRAGRIWSLYTDGVLEFSEDRWVRHPVSDIRLEYARNPMRQVRQIPLLPGAEDRILILLPEKLLEYRALSRQSAVLRQASETKLGPFIDLIAANDGGVWVSGAHGLAKLPGPLRRLGAATVWREHVIPENLGVRNLRRPFEDDDGGITCVVEAVADDRRVLAHFDGTAWLVRDLPGENFRFAWRDTERGRFWGLTMSSLVRLLPDRIEQVQEFGPARQAFDVAVQPRGVFWIATLEGLVRHSPLAWRTPEPAAALTMVHGMVEDDGSRLWFAGEDRLLSLEEGNWRTHRWPRELGLTFRLQDRLFVLPNGLLALAATDQLVLLDPGKEQFRPVRHPADRQVLRVVGQDSGRQLCVQTLGVGSVQLEMFDGARFLPFTNAPPADLAGELFFLTWAKDGDLWAGGSLGPLIRREGKWQRFGPADGYTDDGALCFLEWDEGRVWCAGLGKISEYDGKTWTVVRSGFDRVNSMVRCSDMSVYAATSSELHRFFRDSWTAVGEAEGLPGNSILCVLEDRSRRVWVGASRGLTGYHPRADIDPPRTLTLESETGAEASFERPFRVTPRAVDRWLQTASDRLLFSFRVDERRWSAFTRDQELVLRTLPAGKHRLEVRAMDRNWNLEPHAAALEFTVVVPWHKEPRILIVASVGLLAALFFAALAVNQHLGLRRSYADVGRQVAERSRELEVAMRELAHSQKMTALGTLAAGIAHDFNNILSIIRGSAQVIEGNLDNKEKVLVRVNRIKTVVDQGSGIVKAMLGFGKVSDLQMTACEVRPIMEETRLLLGDRFLRDVTVRCEAPPGLPPARGVRDRLQQMLVNLIFNAADSMNGKGIIELHAGTVGLLPPHLVLAPAEAASYVFVTVMDQGCGIPADVLPRIFEPFYTTKSLSSRPGTGLGLYVVYEFAKEMGFGLRVESQAGLGSRFTIYMPPTEPQPRPAVSSPPPSKPSGKP